MTQGRRYSLTLEAKLRKDAQAVLMRVQKFGLKVAVAEFLGCCSPRDPCFQSWNSNVTLSFSGKGKGVESVRLGRPVSQGRLCSIWMSYC